MNGTSLCGCAMKTLLDWAREHLREEIQAQKFYQFLFFHQWSEIKNYANDAKT